MKDNASHCCQVSTQKMHMQIPKETWKNKQLARTEHQMQNLHCFEETDAKQGVKKLEKV